MRGVLLLIAFAGLSAAAYAQLQAPVLGLIPDGASIRNVNGIAASGAVGASMATNRALANVTVLGNQQAALATAADTGDLLLVLTSGDGSIAQASPILGAASGASRIVASPNGTAAVQWIPATSHLQVLSGLPSAATVSLDIDASPLGGVPGALAVSDNGQWIVGAWSQGVFAIGLAGQPVPMPVDPGTTAIAFFHGRTDIATISAAQVATVADVGGSATPTVLYSAPADAPAPSTAPIAIAMSQDNRYLVAIQPWGGIGNIDLSNGTIVIADCGCTPAGLIGMSATVMRITGFDGASLKVYDASTNDVWLVPLAATSNGGQP